MGNIGGSELLIILVLALLLLGPKRLPEIGEALGRTLRRFRQASRELRDEVESTRTDLGRDLDEIRRQVDVRRNLDEVRREIDVRRDLQGVQREAAAGGAPDARHDVGVPGDGEARAETEDDPAK